MNAFNDNFESSDDDELDDQLQRHLARNHRSPEGDQGRDEVDQENRERDSCDQGREGGEEGDGVGHEGELQ